MAGSIGLADIAYRVVSSPHTFYPPSDALPNITTLLGHEIWEAG